MAGTPKVGESTLIKVALGLFEVHLPENLRYSEIHFWFFEKALCVRCGLTPYALRILGDPFRLEWKGRIGDEVRRYEGLGEVESAKAVAELYAPMEGRLVGINQEALTHPGRLTEDPFGVWLLEFEGVLDGQMDAHGYGEFLKASWEEVQRAMRGGG